MVLTYIFFNYENFKSFYHNIFFGRLSILKSYSKSSFVDSKSNIYIYGRSINVEHKSRTPHERFSYTHNFVLTMGENFI